MNDFNRIHQKSYDNNTLKLSLSPLCARIKFMECILHVAGINEDLIKRFSVILEVITCDASIDPKKFGIYSYDTAKMFVDLYGWYYMLVIVHKVLLHGEKIITAAILLISLLSEEA